MRYLVPMKILILALLSFNTFPSTLSQIDLIYSSDKLAQHLDFSSIESVEFKGNNRYLVTTVNCKTFVDFIEEEIKLNKVTCWPL